MKKKIIAGLSLALLTTTILTGCTAAEKKQDAANDFTVDTYSNTTAPQWDTSSISFLEKDGWKVESYQKYYLDNYNLGIPETFSVSSPDGLCNISYNVDGLPVVDKDLDSNFLAEKYSATTLSKYNNVKLTNSGIKEIQVLNNAPLEMLSNSFNYDIPKTDNEEAPSGTSEGALLVRAFTSPVPNPYYAWQQVGEEKNLPVVSITYTCLGKEIDKTVLDKIVSNAKISFTPLPVTSGAPIAPTVQDKMKVGP